jgi:hypothetical protein
MPYIEFGELVSKSSRWFYKVDIDIEIEIRDLGISNHLGTW